MRVIFSIVVVVWCLAVGVAEAALPADLPHRDRLAVPLTLKVALDGRDAKLVKAYDGDTVVPVALSLDGKYILLETRPNGEWIQVFWERR